MFTNEDDEDEEDNSNNNNNDEDSLSGGEDTRGSRRHRNHSGPKEKDHYHKIDSKNASKVKTLSSASSSSQKAPNPLELILKKIELNEAEKQDIIVGLVKSWMTELLLEITNLEMQAIAKEVVQYEKG